MAPHLKNPKRVSPPWFQKLFLSNHFAQDIRLKTPQRVKAVGATGAWPQWGGIVLPVMDSQELSHSILRCHTSNQVYHYNLGLTMQIALMAVQFSSNAFNRSLLFPSKKKTDPQFRTWIPQTPVLLHHVISSSGLLPITLLLISATVSTMDLGRYHQLSMFVMMLPKLLRIFADLTPVESILTCKQPPQKLISLFYQALLLLKPKLWSTFLTNWEKDLQNPIKSPNQAINAPLFSN